VEKVETLIVGDGQAGLMMGAQLRQRGRPHLILERHCTAAR
jgi:putative flavoprotein involved in K+ transport